MTSAMDKLKRLKNLNWCKSDWKMQEIDPEAVDLLKSVNLQEGTMHNLNLTDIMEKSEAFPIQFPIDSIRVKTLKERVPEDILNRNIKSTYPLIHERVLRLMAQFIVLKRKYGSDIEKSLYKDMTLPLLIDRLFTKRALSFMSRHDKYKLISGEKSVGGWESIGTPNEREPLVLSNCLSYDELKLSAFLYVSSYTVCINDGERRNKGVVQDEALIEKEAVIIGVIGPRFQRVFRMDCEDILITENQNTTENGYGDYQDNEKCAMRKLWAEFYETQNFTYQKALAKVTPKESTPKMKKDERKLTSTFLTVGKEGTIFNNEVYHKRISIIAECSLIEAQTRALDVNKNAYLNVIGCGLGVWKISSHQNDVYVLSFIERIRSLLYNNAISNVTDVNFAYIKITDTLKGYFQKDFGILKTFISNQGHPKGGISITIKDREPSSRLKDEHEGKLLIMTYPWDGNAQPGNEFWLGKLSSSGDPAAACSTQVSELHNPFINNMVNAVHTRTVNNGTISTMQEYCQNVG